MEDEAQKMVALKKAYADIILNTAKEAAARILVAEKKALRFHGELCSSRDEALRMLLRLKNMLDSKTAEAELNSLSQQRRISELETQLREAEGVITDLRAELKQKGDELENAKRNQVRTLSHVPLSSDLKDIPMNPTVSKQTERPSDEFISIIMRSEKPESYRNGCTQRIRALEGNGKLPPDGAESEKEIRNDSVTETEKKRLSKACSVRKRKNRFGNGKKTTRTCSRGQISKLVDEGSQESLQLDDEFKIFNKGKRKRNVKSRELSRCRTFSYFLKGRIESVDNDQSKSSENEAKVLVRKDLEPSSVSTPVFSDDVSKLSEAVENSTIDDKESNDKATEKNMKLKYTFQRKRKREAMSGPNEMALPEKISDASELQKSGSVEESSRDSRRLAQVARQLISLSGKRWQCAKQGLGFRGIRSEPPRNLGIVQQNRGKLG